MTTYQMWLTHMTSVANLENFKLSPNFALSLRKSDGILSVIIKTTSKVISRKIKRLLKEMESPSPYRVKGGGLVNETSSS